MGSFIPRGLGVTSLTKSDVNRIQLVKCQENPIIELTCRNLSSVGSDHYLLYNFFHKLHARNLRKLNTMHVTKFGLYFRSVWETTVFVSQILIVANFLSIVNQFLAAGSSTRSSYNTFLCASKRILATAGLVTLTQRVLGHTVFAVEELPSVLRRVPATRRLCTSCATDQLHQDEPTSCRLHASRPLPKRVCRVLQV